MRRSWFVVLVLFLLVLPLVARGEDQPKQPYLGVAVEEEDGKFVVTDVTAGSPAEKAGLKVGDAFVSIDGKPVKAQADVGDTIKKKKVGDELAMVVLRDGKQIALKAVLVARPEPQPEPEPEPEG